MAHTQLHPDRKFVPAFGGKIDTEIKPEVVDGFAVPPWPPWAQQTADGHILFVETWFGNDVVHEVPDTVAPFLSAQGYVPYNILKRGDLYGNFIGYKMSMKRDTFDQKRAIQNLVDLWGTLHNEGRDHNHRRYRDLVNHFETLIDKSQLALGDAWDELHNDIEYGHGLLTALMTDYNRFVGTSVGDQGQPATGLILEISALTSTLQAERDRVEIAFDALNSTIGGQQLVNKGFYSSVIPTTVNAGVEVKRQEALTDIAEKEARMKAELLAKQNQLYQGIIEMRQGIIEEQMKLTNRYQEFMAYELDTRNKLAQDLFKLVEGREDSYPGFGDLSALVTSLSSGVET